MRLYTFIFLLFSLSFRAMHRDSLYIPPEKKLIEDCDACGCAVGGGASGFDAFLNPRFVGIRSMAQQYTSALAESLQGQKMKEHYHSLQIWARLPIGERWEVFGSIPYHHHTRQNGARQEITGLGDLHVSAAFRILGHSTQGHRLYAGGGLKMPWAKFDQNLTQWGYNPSFQLGTGSWDWNFILHHSFVKGRWATQLSLDYSLKGQNPKYYRFGDQLNLGVGLYYLKNFGRVLFSPRLGLQYENYAQNVQVGQYVPHTGGYILVSKGGAEVSYRRISWGIEVQLPIAQDLSAGQVGMNQRMSLFLNLNL